ncbi:hypothetical protein SMQE30_04870 [Serratia marcescens]|nr:hypothetical protein SMQE30_04870 [Serratia marcescens]
MANYKVLYKLNGKESDLIIQRAAQPASNDLSVLKEVIKHVLDYQSQEIDSDELVLRILYVAADV